MAWKKVDGKIRLKRLFKRENLCYSVNGTTADFGESLRESVLPRQIGEVNLISKASTVGGFGNRETHNSKMQFVEDCTIRPTRLGRKIIEAPLPDKFVTAFVGKQRFHLICLPVSKLQVKRCIEPIWIWQIQAGSNSGSCIFNSDKKRAALFLDMREIIVGFIASFFKQ